MKARVFNEKFQHPLTNVVLEYAVMHEKFDLPDIITYLSGATTLRPAKGVRAYAIVAADVLGCMVMSGRLKMYGKWANARCPERGGPTFSLPDPVKEVVRDRKGP